MATLSLKISLDGGAVVKTIQFDPSTTVYDACRIIREKILEAGAGDPKDYGLFLTSSDEDSKKGIWLEPSRSLDYYILRNGDVLEYNKKTRNLRVRMLDGTVKTLLVDDSQVIANLMVVICTKIGITNHDEYGLVREEIKDENEQFDKSNIGTLTIKKRKPQEKERDAKMEQLRRKLRTDDEVNWVEASKTLTEQGIEPTETLLLRRRLFFSDRNVDSRDPVQLNLLYVQARDAILDGKHPVTQQKACEFAGIQCQIQFGDHKEDKHKPGFLDLKEFLPQSYIKTKNIEKMVYKEHRRHIGLSELDSKVLYTKTARDLSTYGVSFFLVKEKMQGKNKLVPRLLGVSKDKVLRLDARTKEILQSWLLTRVRRWCASPNTFTLDFGDYSDQYYSVQTTEAEQILQVIAGYIDITLKKNRAKEHLGIEGDEGSAMLEDSVAPSRANIIQHDTYRSGKVNTESVAKPAVLRPGAEGAKTFAVGHMTGAQQTTVSGQIITGHAPPTASQSQQSRVTSLLSEPQRALCTTISSGVELIQKTEESLVRTSIGQLDGDPASQAWRRGALDTSRQLVTSHIAAMNAATAHLVTLTNGATEEVDHTAVGAAITTITSNLPEVGKGVQMIAALMDDNDNGDKLLDATRKLCSAFSDLLKAAEPETKEPRQNLLNAASRVGEASTSVLHTITEETPYDKETQDILLSLAKAVANTTAALVIKAKNVAAQCKGDQVLQNNIIAAATNCALATSQLVACAKVVAPTLQAPACRAQLSAAAEAVSTAVTRLLQAAGDAGSPDLQAAAKDLAEALQRLLDHAHHERTPRRAVELVVEASERVTASGAAPDMLRGARDLAMHSAGLIQRIQLEAEREPSEQHQRLLAAAKLLADATARMMEAARMCASHPQDSEKQAVLRKAAEEVKMITVDYAEGVDVTSSQVSRLEETCRSTTASANQLIAAARSANPYNSNKYTQESLETEVRNLEEVVPRVVSAANRVASDVTSCSRALHLVSCADELLQRGSEAVTAARASLPTLESPAEARHLASTAATLADDNAQLRSALNLARVSCKGLEVTAALETLSELQQQLDEIEDAYRSEGLRPLPQQTMEWTLQSLHQSSLSAASSAAALRGAAVRRDTARSLGQLSDVLRRRTGAVRAAVALQPAAADRIIASERQTLETTMKLVETLKTYMSTTETIYLDHMVEYAQQLNKNLEQTSAAIPTHVELDEAIENISETLHILEQGELPHTERSYSSLQPDVSAAAARLSTAAGGVATSVSNVTTAGSDVTTSLGDAARTYGDEFNGLTGLTLELAASTEDVETRMTIIKSMKSITINSTKLLSTAKSVSQDLNRSNAKNKLAAAAREVTESINKLVDVTTSASPAVAACEAACRRMLAARPLLSSASQPVSDLTYYCNLEQLVLHSKLLSESMSNLAQAVRSGSASALAEAANGAATAVTALAECQAHAAYLVGISDPSSVSGRAGVVNLQQVDRAAAALRDACVLLQRTDGGVDKHQILSAATVVARHTSALCNACRAASGRSGRAHHKRTFVTAAKDVANCTAALVKDIKATDHDYTQEGRERCAASTLPLLAAVAALQQFAAAPEFQPRPALLSEEALVAQEPILQCGRDIITSSCAMVRSAASLSASNEDRAQWQQLAAHSKTVSDSIKSLVSHIREKAPGQKECTEGIETLNQLCRTIDQAIISPPQADGTLEVYSEQIEKNTAELLERLEPLKVAAKSEAENLGHAVRQLTSLTPPLSAACVRAAALSAHPGLLPRTRTVLEALEGLLRAAGVAGGNPRAVSSHEDLEEQTNLARCGIQELAELARQGGAAPLLDCLSRAVHRLTSNRMSLIESFDETFVDYQTRMVAAAKEISKLASDMSIKAVSDPRQLNQLSSEACGQYEKLAGDCVGAAGGCAGDIGARLRTTVSELGEACTKLVTAAHRFQANTSETNRNHLSDSVTFVNEKVMHVLAVLQEGARGSQACTEVAAALTALLGDLDTAGMFASAGTLQSEDDTVTFASHREAILRTAKGLVEDTKGLVAGAAKQHLLPAAAKGCLNTAVQLCEVVKQGATSLGSSNPEAQVLLLRAARDVLAALRDLTGAARGAGTVGTQDCDALKHHAKVMVTNVTSLLKTVKSVEDEHTRGTRALEATIEAISQDIATLQSPTRPTHTVAPSELARHTRAMSAATARAVSATGQAALATVGNVGRCAVADLLVCCKAAAFGAETEEAKLKTLEAGKDAAEAYRALLIGVLNASQEPSARAALPELSRNVAKAVAEIIAAADLLKGSEWVDPSDPTVIAETELLGAAASIEAAAKKLDALKPRASITVPEADTNLNIDDMIIEAARAIISASSNLVEAASAAQRELVQQGKVSRSPLPRSDDGQWSEGLVSAARLVAGAAHALAEAAGGAVRGAGSERLVSAARHVASCTAQLLVACKVKAEPNSESTRRLQQAGAMVIRSTERLVAAARDAAARDEELTLVLNRRMVGGIAQEIDARSEVLRIEKELDEARCRLNLIRQAKYKPRTGDTSGDETDDAHAGYSSDASGYARFRTPNSSIINTTYSPNSTYTPNATQNVTNISSAMSQLNQSIHGTPKSPTYISYNQNSPSYNQNNQSFTQNTSSYSQNTQGYNQNATGYQPQQNTESKNASYTKSEYSQSQSYSQNKSDYGQNTSFQKTVLNPTFSSFKPQDEQKQNYEGFTTRYETRLYDTPKPTEFSSVEEKRQYESNQYVKQQKYGYYDNKPTSPISPKFNARELKFEDKSEPIYSTLNKPGTPKGDGVGQSFSEHQKSTEAIPGGTKHTEYSVKGESYQSYPKTEFSKTETRHEVRSPFATSTPSKFESDYYHDKSLVKAQTPEYERISSPYGKEVHSYGGPNFMEETTTEVKEIPNGTQKITTTKIYSSSPVNITSTNTKYEPIKLEGIDELSKFESDSKYSTLDSRFNTLDSKMSSDTSRSFMRPSEFQSSDYQSSTNVIKVKSPDMMKELDGMDKKISKTIKSETIERKSVMTSSHKSETSSTVTKKFGNF